MKIQFIASVIFQASPDEMFYKSINSPIWKQTDISLLLSLLGLNSLKYCQGAEHWTVGTMQIIRYQYKNNRLLCGFVIYMLSTNICMPGMKKLELELVRVWMNRHYTVHSVH